jgi:hypothetical protein
MTEIVPTEQVRADRIKEGDRVWLARRFQIIGKLSNGGAVVAFWGSDGNWLIDLYAHEMVLRQPAPVSLAGIDAEAEQALGDAIEEEDHDGSLTS